MDKGKLHWGQDKWLSATWSNIHVLQLKPRYVYLDANSTVVNEA